MSYKRARNLCVCGAVGTLLPSRREAVSSQTQGRQAGRVAVSFQATGAAGAVEDVRRQTSRRRDGEGRRLSGEAAIGKALQRGRSDVRLECTQGRCGYPGQISSYRARNAASSRASGRAPVRFKAGPRDAMRGSGTVDA
ncbi:hypothetical protein P280DRAFT_44112 [Massarina eburnea CBS 473.64]|uniref:Uncharacterized protein n=1 Tax=Massarina eburnea CBS 473.64 TaxID=1395130 RepID=A0A6A6RYX3_9PLEO|nr:hypothetical protein P280DRAFT_44112 [Massarina eburnea CBS 473.64]